MSEALLFIGPGSSEWAARLTEKYVTPDPITLPLAHLAFPILGSYPATTRIGVVAVGLGEEEIRQIAAYLREQFETATIAAVGHHLEALASLAHLGVFPPEETGAVAQHLGLPRRLTTRIISPVNIKGGAGKSTVIANLAAVLAKQGQKVLLIDGDFTDGDISGLTGKEEEAEEQSLTRLFQSHPMGGFTWEDVQRHILTWQGVDILCSTSLLDEHLSRMRHTNLPAELMHLAEGQYDYVLIDLPADKRFSSSFGLWTMQHAPRQMLLFLLIAPPLFAEEKGAIRAFSLLRSLKHAERTALVQNRWETGQELPVELTSAGLPVATRIPSALDLVQRSARDHLPLFAYAGAAPATKGRFGMGSQTTTPDVAEQVAAAYQQLAQFVTRYFEGAAK